ITLVLSGLVFTAAYRFVSRTAPGDWISRCFDAFLLTYAVQYVSVTLPGILRILSPLTMCIAAVALSALLWYVTPVAVRPDPGLDASGPASALDSKLLIFCFLFIIGFFCGIISVGLY